jgi:transposase
LVANRDRLVLGEGGFWGAQTGPNPTDRGKAGSKHHVLTDAGGIPLAAKVTAANDHDVTQLLPLAVAIPPVGGKPGPPRRLPERLQGDRAYDSEDHRRILRWLGITPILARRNTENGSGLGKHRWVVERTLSWLHQYRRLRVRYERRVDIHQAFVDLGCILICYKTLIGSFC